MALNETQKNILEGTLNYLLGDVSEFNNKSHAYKVLELMSSPNSMSLSEKNKLQQWDVLGEVEQIREILAHPNPQNRSVSYPYIGQEPGMALSYPYGAEHIEANLQREPLGLLGLTASNDDTALPVTKADVTEYIIKEINNRIENLRSQGVVPTVIDEDITITTQQSSVDSRSALFIPPLIQEIFSENPDGFNRLRSGNEAQGISPVSVEELAYLGQGNIESLEVVLERPDLVHSYMSRGVPFSAIAEIGCRDYGDISMRALLERPQKVFALMESGTSFDDIAKIAASDPDALGFVLDHTTGFQRLRSG
ncbi:MAG: hypothetical protein V4568_17440, partial [Pseudomonadota bacterium]